MTFFRMIIAALMASLFIGASLWLVAISPVKFSSYNLETINSFSFYSGLIGFFIIATLGFPVVALLKKFNKFNWKYILIYSFLIGFILMGLLLQVWRYETIFNIDSYSLLHCFMVGIASMVTGAIFYKTLKILEK